jgi:hypothetical protein
MTAYDFHFNPQPHGLLSPGREANPTWNETDRPCETSRRCRPEKKIVFHFFHKNLAIFLKLTENLNSIISS